MLIREKMERTKLSAAEQELAESLLQMGLEIEDMTIRQIAQATFTSPSLLVRFAQKLEFSGWNEFKKAFLQETTYLQSHFQNIDANRPFTPADSLITITGKMGTLYQESIADTMDLMDYKALQSMVDLLYKAEHIHCLAVSNNINLVEEFVHNLRRIGKRVSICTQQGELQFSLNPLSPKDVLFIVSYSGTTPILVRCAHLAAERKIPVCALTSIGDNPISALSRACLRISTREKLFSKIATFSTDTSISFLLSLIYAGLYNRDYVKNWNSRVERSRQIEQGRRSSLEILKED